MRRLSLIFIFTVALAALAAQEPVPLYGPGEPTDHSHEDEAPDGACSPFNKKKPCGQKESCKQCIGEGKDGYPAERMRDGKYLCAERCHTSHCGCPDPCGRMTRNGTPKGCAPKSALRAEAAE